MNHAIFCIFVTLCSVCAAYSQQVTELQLTGGSDGDRSLHAPTFSKSGEYLFTLASLDRIRVHRTSDGALIREFDLPTNRQHNDVLTDASLYQFSGRLSVTSDGKQLIINTRPRSTGQRGGVIWLVDTETLVSGRDVTPTALNTQGYNVNFVCSLDSDRLIFDGWESVAATRNLFVYDLDWKEFDSGAKVELNNIVASALPNHLAVSQHHKPYLYLIGIDEDGDFLALRVTPTKAFENLFVPQSCLIEKLRIRWNESGYASTEVVDRGTLPYLPTAVSPTLSHYLCQSWSQSSSSKCTVSVGLERIDATNQRPTPVRRVLAEINRAIGSRTGTWSADGQFLFVCDGHDSSRRRPTAISVHDRSGRQFGFIPTGEAHSANALAVSSDGRFVVTYKGLRLPASRTAARKKNSDRKKRGDQHEYQAWELQ